VLGRSASGVRVYALSRTKSRSIFAIGQAITNAVTEVFGGLTEGVPDQ
jgi:hypothetical protein